MTGQPHSHIASLRLGEEERGQIASQRVIATGIIKLKAYAIARLGINWFHRA